MGLPIADESFNRRAESALPGMWGLRLRLMFLAFLFMMLCVPLENSFIYEEFEESDEQINDYFHSSFNLNTIYVIPGHKRLCYFQNVKSKGRILYNFQAWMDLEDLEASELVITLSLPNDHNLITIRSEDSDDSSRALNITSGGDIEYCFDNTMLPAAAHVWFSLRFLNDEKKPSKSINAMIVAREITARYQEITSSIFRWSLQTKKHIEHIQKRKHSVIYSSLFICISIVVASVFHVILIRRLFGKYR